METSVNNKCRAFTSLEQSRKLAEILPLESADMAYIASATDNDGETLYTAEYKSEIIIYEADDYINCWSLAALLNYLREIDFFPNIEVDEHSITMSISYYNEEEARPLAPVHNVIVEADTFVDACYELILKLNKLNML